MNTRDLPPHSLMIVHGEIEVCSTCVNSAGYPVAWELTWHEQARRPDEERE